MSQDYSEYQEPNNTNLLSKISEAAIRQKELEAEVAKLEEQTAAKREELRNVSEVIIPELMDAAEMKSFTLKDGSKISIEEKIRASIPAKFQHQAFKWLTDHNQDALIKEQYVVDFDREQTELSKEFKEYLEDKYSKDVLFKHKKAVHPQTLASYVKGALEEGIDVPTDLFGVLRQRFTKIKE